MAATRAAGAAAVQRGCSLVWSVVAWVLFKALQATVGGAFTLIILVQAWVAGVLCWLRPPPALGKVQAAREAQDAGVTAAAAARALESEGAGLKQQPPKPLHIFPDPSQGHDSLAWQLVGPYMRKYGRHAIANSQLFNPEYIHFFVPGVGALPYVVSDMYNRAAVVGTGEPLADRAAWRSITQLFLQEFPEAYFYHITEEYADLLHDMGYYINGCGTETTLQVQSWAYSARTRTIRSSARSARDSGVRVRELKPEELTDGMRLKLQHDVTGCWMQRKAIADRGLRVFVRDVDYDNLELRDGIRVFVAEAYDPAVAPPANVDPVLQGAALNAKPPKPPRVRSVKSLRQGHSAGADLASFKARLPHSKSEGFALDSSSRSSGGSSAISSRNSTPEPVPLAPLQCGTSSSSGSSTITVRSCSTPTDGSDSPTGVADMASVASEGAGSPDSSRLQLAACNSDGANSYGNGSSPRTDRLALLDIQLSALVSEGLPAADKAASATAAAAAAGGAAKCRVHEQPPAKASAVLQVQRSQTGAAAAAAAEAPAAAPAAAVLAAPELVGFVLLDPLWEDEQEVGCVTSIMRAKRSAHQGTLKLLIEDIVSTLRKEGKRELTFGFAPLYNMNDSVGRRRLHWMRWVALYIFHCANNVYAFRNLAFSKTRYGAGLNAAGTAFNDPNVTLTYVYMAAPYYTPGWSILDLYGFMHFVGLICGPVSVFLKLVGLQKGGENLK